MTRTLAEEVVAYLAVRTGAPGTVRAEQAALERYMEFVGGGDMPPPHPPDLARFRDMLRRTEHVTGFTTKSTALGQRVRAARVAAGFKTQAALIDQLNDGALGDRTYSVSWLRAIEAGAHGVHVDDLEMLAHVLRVRLDDLLKGDALRTTHAAGPARVNHATNAVERLYRWLGEQGRLPEDSPYLEAPAGTVVREAVGAERYPRPDFATCTLAEAVETWLRWNRIERANRLQPKTVETYGRALRDWRAHLDGTGTDWRDAGRTDVRAFVRQRRERISRRSVAPEVAAVRLFYVWAEAEGAPLRAAPGNQIARLRWKQPPRRPAPFVKEAEMPALLAVYRDSLAPADLRDTAILEVLYASGLRVSELTALDVLDVDLTDHSIRVRHGKGDRERMALMHARAAAAVERYLQHGRPRFKPQPHERALFLGHRGTRITTRAVQLMVKAAGEASGAGVVTPHMLRFSFATHLHENGMDLRMIQELMGHASADMTSSYIGTSLPRLASVVEGSLDRARTPRRRPDVEPKGA